MGGIPSRKFSQRLNTSQDIDQPWAAVKANWARRECLSINMSKKRAGVIQGWELTEHRPIGHFFLQGWILLDWYHWPHVVYMDFWLLKIFFFSYSQVLSRAYAKFKSQTSEMPKKRWVSGWSSFLRDSFSFPEELPWVDGLVQFSNIPIVQRSVCWDFWKVLGNIHSRPSDHHLNEKIS